MEITENVNMKRLESEVMEYACKLKGSSFLFTAADLEPAMAAAETNSSLAEALRVYEKWSDTDNKALEFQRILGNFSSESLDLLACALQVIYHTKLLKSKIAPVTDEARGREAHLEGIERSVNVSYCYPAAVGGEKVKDSGGGGGGGGGGFPMNSALQTIGGAFAKVFFDKAIAGFELSSTSPAAPWVKPCGNGATACGCLCIMAGMALQEKQQGLSKIMVKLGAVAMAFAVLLPMTVSLPPMMAWIFGVIAASIVLITALLS